MTENKIILTVTNESELTIDWFKKAALEMPFGECRYVQFSCFADADKGLKTINRLMENLRSIRSEGHIEEIQEDWRNRMRSAVGAEEPHPERLKDWRKANLFHIRLERVGRYVVLYKIPHQLNVELYV